MEDVTYSNGSLNGNVDPAFKKIKKNFSDFLIWRIEAMTVTPLPRDQYGTFYDADSYIIYAAAQYGQPIGIHYIPRETRGYLEMHIHFWLGKNTTNDKSGVAAYKTVELDGYLGGGATQHRETQGNESARFKSYFKDGFRLLKGGTATGFRTVSNVFEPKLYKIKGKRTPILTEQDSISWNHFNSGDVFLIHTPQVLFVWVGRAANSVEKLHSTKVSMQLKIEHNTPNIVFVDDGYEQTMTEGEKQIFEKFLPLSSRHVLPEDEGGDDAETEKLYRSTMRLYQCSDASGKYRVTEVKLGPLKQTDLDSDDVFILDHGPKGIWVWVGKRATDRERIEAMRNARGFVKKKNYPDSTNVTRVVDGAEPIEFKLLFTSWKEKHETKGLGKVHNVGKIAKVSLTNFDAALMHERPAMAAESQLFDDGSGSLTIWRLNKSVLVEIPNDKHGIFFAGDCYVLSYNYRTTSGQKYIIYYWQGLHAQQNEKVASALRAVEKDEETGGVAVQVRVVQGHEPAHFMQIFKGKMIIFRGRGIEFDETGTNSKIPARYLLHIQGNATFNTKATQVHCKAASLDSNYCFILKKNKHFFVWCGNFSTGDQREMAKGFAGKDFELVLEGKESSQFWEAIGGKTPYVSVKLVSDDGDPRPARLFQCSTATGKFKAEEIFNFIQTDLVPEDVMLLDAHDTLFLWIGKYSTAEERKLSQQLAKEYLQSDPTGRDIKTPIATIKQGNEPPTFTGFFGVWDETLWADYKSFESIRSDIEERNESFKHYRPTEKKTLNQNFDQHQKYPPSYLRKPQADLPPKVNPQKKELLQQRIASNLRSPVKTFKKEEIITPTNTNIILKGLIKIKAAAAHIMQCKK